MLNYQRVVGALGGKQSSHNRLKLPYTSVIYHVDEGLQMFVRMHALKRRKKPEVGKVNASDRSVILVISCSFLLLLRAHLYPLCNCLKSQTLSRETGQLHCIPRARPNVSADAWRFISMKVVLDPFTSQPLLKRAHGWHGLVPKLTQIIRDL